MGRKAAKKVIQKVRANESIDKALYVAHAVIIYHANHKKYPEKWISDFVLSIRNQTKLERVLELDYAGGTEPIYEGSLFFSRKLDYEASDKATGKHTGHSHAHNWLCKKAIELGCDYVFNTNIDDIYHFERIERQLPYLEQGFDVVTCNMTQIDEENRILRQDILFSQMDILAQAKKNHNIIAHPACAYSRNFVLNSGLLNPNEVPKDDFELWKRSYPKFKFKIAPYTMLFYRIHQNNVSKK